MRDMKTAPRDGTRILVLDELRDYELYSSKYRVIGSRWIEAWFKPASGGTEARFAEWLGKVNRSTTGRLYPLGWVELP